MKHVRIAILSATVALALAACGGSDRGSNASTSGPDASGAAAPPAVDRKGAELTGAGATFIYPLISRWSTTYNEATGNRINYQSIGSGGSGLSEEPKSTVPALIWAIPPPEPMDW